MIFIVPNLLYFGDKITKAKVQLFFGIKKEQQNSAKWVCCSTEYRTLICSNSKNYANYEKSENCAKNANYVNSVSLASHLD